MPNTLCDDANIHSGDDAQYGWSQLYSFITTVAALVGNVPPISAPLMTRAKNNVFIVAWPLAQEMHRGQGRKTLPNSEGATFHTEGVL